MKILVTGGAGFIGSHVVDEYLNNGHDVVVVDNLYSGNVSNINKKAKLYLLDIRSDELDKVFEIEKPDIVNHHAAQMSVPISTKDPAMDLSINVYGTVRLLMTSVQHNVKRFIFISSGGTVYGECNTLPIPEAAPLQPMSPYGIAKHSAEEYVNFFKTQHGLDYTILRYANVYGPRQMPHGEAGVVIIFMMALLSGNVPTIYHYPDEPEGMLRDYCYVADVSRANERALTCEANRIFNIGTGMGTRTGEIYRAIIKCMRAKGYCQDSKYDTPVKGPAREGDLKQNAIDCTHAATTLGWTSRTLLEEGINETLDYFLKQNR